MPIGAGGLKIKYSPVEESLHLRGHSAEARAVSEEQTVTLAKYILGVAVIEGRADESLGF